MIQHKRWRKHCKRTTWVGDSLKEKMVTIPYEGWFLFGVIPLYISEGPYS